MTWRQPVGRLRTTLVTVRALLDGDRRPLDREGVRAFRLGAPPERRVPILLAALAPSSIRLAGELADHWLPFLWARSRLPDGRTLLAEGEAQAETPAQTGVTVTVPLAIAQDDEATRQIAAGWLVAYLTRMGPLYPRMLRDHFGFAPQVDALLDANADVRGRTVSGYERTLAHSCAASGIVPDRAPSRERHLPQSTPGGLSANSGSVSPDKPGKRRRPA